MSKQFHDVRNMKKVFLHGRKRGMGPFRKSLQKVKTADRRSEATKEDTTHVCF